MLIRLCSGDRLKQKTSLFTSLLHISLFACSGWDGKPIPFWLYKLHGLGVEYKCEICGNYSYWGRRAFERHFQEWRHAFGMRCLKIPNTVHFKVLHNKGRESVKHVKHKQYQYDQ